MSRETTAAYDSANDAAHFDEVIFAELQFASGTSYVCTREHDIVWNGQTWLGRGRVGTIEAIEEAGELEPRGVEMTLAVSAELLALALDPAEYKNRTCRMWRGLLAADKYLSLPGTAGNYASTPDSAVVSITGDIDVRAKLALANWASGAYQTVLCKEGAAGLDYLLTVSRTGNLGFFWRASFGGSTVALGLAAGITKWVRATRASASGDLFFYTSDDGVTWTQLGGNAAGGAGALTAGAAAVVSVGWRPTPAVQPLAGKVYYAEVRNGIGGTVVASPDFTKQERAATSFHDAQGNAWAINQSGSPAAQIVHGDVAVVADPVGPFRFRMDALEFELGETGLIRLTAESRLADWQRPRVRYYNDADQQAEHPGDDFFGNAEQMVDAVLIW